MIISLGKNNVYLSMDTIRISIIEFPDLAT